MIDLPAELLNRPWTYDAWFEEFWNEFRCELFGRTQRIFRSFLRKNLNCEIAGRRGQFGTHEFEDRLWDYALDAMFKALARIEISERCEYDHPKYKDIRDYRSYAATYVWYGLRSGLRKLCKRADAREERQQDRSLQRRILRKGRVRRQLKTAGIPGRSTPRMMLQTIEVPRLNFGLSNSNFLRLSCQRVKTIWTG